MGCILACLRFKDDKKRNKAHLKSSPVPSKSKEPLLPNDDRFVSVFISEVSSCEQVADLEYQDIRDQDILDQELREEVEFLKSCGAILETPAELRKTEELTTQPHNKDIKYSDCSTGLGDSPVKKLVLNQEQEDSNCAQNSSSVFIFGEHQEQKPSTNAVLVELGQESLSQDDTTIVTHCTKHEPEIEPEVESGVLDVSPTQDDTHIQTLGPKHSPYPTPLKLTDDMETPRTTYPSSYEKLRRKNARVRTQFVYPILNPVENLTQRKEKRGSFKQLNQKDTRSRNMEDLDKENYGSVKRLRHYTPVSSLSRWVKLRPENDDKNQTEANAVKYSFPDRTPDVDKPIFGIVAMHWNDNDDPSKVSPKGWDGNGIPNTTTKYKEDQKVCWHATPFEERLHKALTDDTLIPQRKDISRKLTGFTDEGEENDTASS